MNRRRKPPILATLLGIFLFAFTGISQPVRLPAALSGVPREVVRIIDPDNGPGTHYTSLEEFATREKRDLVALNEIAVAVCRSSKGSPDRPAQFDKWTTDREHYVRVVADDGHRATAQWDDRKYRIIEHSSGNSECIDVEIDNIVIDGLQLRITGSGASNDVIDPEAGDFFRIQNCFLWMEISDPGGSGMDLKSDAEIINCVIKGSGSSGIVASDGARVSAYNNTFVGWAHALEAENATIKAVNNLARHIRVAAYFAKDGGVFTADSDFNSSNLSGDGLVKGPRTSNVVPWYSGSISDLNIFVDAAGNDFHLRPNTVFGRVGLGPALDSEVPEYDIDLQRRSGPTTDLGADLEGGTVGIDPGSPQIPRSAILHPNFPNPFNSQTVISYQLYPHGPGEVSKVELTVHNLLGQTVKTLVRERQPAGPYAVRWDGRDETGLPVGSGVYYYRLRTAGLEGVQTRKMMLLK